MAILGASGCGKSMTLKCIAGIETPDEGYIELDGRVFFDSEHHINRKPQERNVGYLFQDYALFPTMTVYENLRCATKKDEEIKQYVERFCLQGLEHLYPRALSGGQKQRVALARMLAKHPDLILFDEPFSALDNHLRTHMEREIMGLLEEYEGISILVSHDRNEVFRMTERIGVMCDGTMLCVEEKHEFFNHPKSLAQTLLTGCKNVSRVTFLKEDGNKVYYEAKDWGIPMVLTKREERDYSKVSYLALRAHYFQGMEWKDDSREDFSRVPQNCIPCTLVRSVEDTFSMSVLLSNPKASGGEYSLITYEVDHGIWEKEGMESWKGFLLEIPEEKVILLDR